MPNWAWLQYMESGPRYRLTGLIHGLFNEGPHQIAVWFHFEEFPADIMSWQPCYYWYIHPHTPLPSHTPHSHSPHTLTHPHTLRHPHTLTLHPHTHTHSSLHTLPSHPHNLTSHTHISSHNLTHPPSHIYCHTSSRPLYNLVAQFRISYLTTSLMVHSGGILRV